MVRPDGEGQLRGALRAGLTRWSDQAPEWLASGAVARAFAARVEGWAPPAAGRVASEGDVELAYLRFAGTNPFTIRRARQVSDVPERLRLPDDVFASLVGEGPSLAERVLAGDVFVSSYDALRVSAADDLQPGKYVAPVSALFVHAPGLSARFPVVPVAIACASGTPDGGTEVVLPTDGWRWRAAKRMLQVADVHASELEVHLARTHYMTVPFAIAMRRRLSAAHPIRQFLMPHLRYNLFVDRMAWLQGVRASSGVLVRSLAGSARWSQAVAKTLWYEASFREQHFERDLAARGLSEVPFDLPFRDDGRLLWEAIRRFTGAYVELTYADDAALRADAALHAFLAEVASPDAGNVRGLLEGERLETRNELVEILTQVLFVAGPVHALCHYGSAAQLQDVQDSPSWLIANPLATGVDATPSRVGGLAQLTRVVSTNVRHDTLGDFARYPLGGRPECRPMVAAFQADLRSIEDEIGRRNLDRPAPYLHLLPSRLTNGITV
ncbi:MAG: lipoxygenase family protein [Pseudomonadota bacterium]|nr:lipoxygenase family protein [Pseudomonadota bacterium]